MGQHTTVPWKGWPVHTLLEDTVYSPRIWYVQVPAAAGCCEYDPPDVVTTVPLGSVTVNS